MSRSHADASVRRRQVAAAAEGLGGGTRSQLQEEGMSRGRGSCRLAMVAGESETSGMGRIRFVVANAGQRRAQEELNNDLRGGHDPVPYTSSEGWSGKLRFHRVAGKGASGVPTIVRRRGVEPARARLFCLRCVVVRGCGLSDGGHSFVVTSFSFFDRKSVNSGCRSRCRLGRGSGVSTKVEVEDAGRMIRSHHGLGPA